jgi:hypothetical protein
MAAFAFKVRDLSVATTNKVRRKLASVSKVAKDAKVLKLRVGIFGPAASSSHGEASNVEVASFHEFGTEHVPQRSFIRATVLARLREINSMYERIAKGAIEGKITLHVGYDIMGEYIRSEMQQTIRAQIPPPLKPETIDRKNRSVGGGGASTPLIDTGQLINSIAFEVVRS